MKPLPVYQVDAFASEIFRGNPAAVCPLESWPDDALMQAIAAENNLAETAFFAPEGDGYRLRWFTPELEIDLCGHATLASAHVLCHHLGLAEPEIRFYSRSGLLTVRRDGGRYVLDFPARAPAPMEPPPALLRALHGQAPRYCGRSRDYLAVLGSEAQVRALQPDLEAVRELDAIGLIVSAPGDHCDFVSRFFAPQAGVPEDPVTGSAHCTLVPYWGARLGQFELHAMQVSRRGGELWCTLSGDRVLMAGSAVTYMSGMIYL
jgi:PhzF family phenazine biosynthesis protein